MFTNVNVLTPVEVEIRKTLHTEVQEGHGYHYLCEIGFELYVNHRSQVDAEFNEWLTERIKDGIRYALANAPALV